MTDSIQQERKLWPIDVQRNRICIMMLIVCLFVGFTDFGVNRLVSVAPCALIGMEHMRARKDRAYFEGRGDIVWEVPSAGRRISLTFDDGPDSIRTPAILDLLKQYDAKATFFVTGSRVKSNEELVKRALREGHEIGNHTYHHKYFRRSIPSKEIKQEMMKAHRVIEEVTGVSPQLFRPPGGYYSERLVQVARDHGYRIVMWSWHQDTQDWRSPGVNRIVSKVLKHAREGDIVLMHDYVNKGKQTIQALQEILPKLKSRGYSFVTVSELMTHCVRKKTF